MPLLSEHIVGFGNIDPLVYLADKNAKKKSFMDFLDIICCPMCYKDVKLNKEFLICISCKRKYLIKDGIPDMLVGNA